MRWIPSLSILGLAASLLLTGCGSSRQAERPRRWDDSSRRDGQRWDAPANSNHTTDARPQRRKRRPTIDERPMAQVLRGKGPATTPATPTDNTPRRESDGAPADRTSRSTRQQIDQVLREARRYEGTPYRLGGTTRSGMDCSGLMLISFRAAGIELPRTANEQSRHGKHVNISAVRPGDILFFSTSKPGGPVNHSGLVVRNEDGKVEFLHASTSKGVRVDDLLQPYWAQRIRHARRVID